MYVNQIPYLKSNPPPNPLTAGNHKAYLVKKFEAGARSGLKADPVQVMSSTITPSHFIPFPSRFIGKYLATVANKHHEISKYMKEMVIF